MIETPQPRMLPAPIHRAQPAIAPVGHRAAEQRPAGREAVDPDHDPVTDWLLERDDLDGTEFIVLFAVHKLRARRGRGGWVGHAELCRSTRLAPDVLARVLQDLRSRGLLGMMRHPVKIGCARYLLIVQG